MRHISCVVLLLLAAPLRAEPPKLTLPAEMKARPGRMVQIPLDTDAASWVWQGAEADSDLISFPGVKAAIFSAPAAGTYRVTCFGASKTGETAMSQCLVTVGTPTPPVPPDPPPTDPLVQALQAAYKLDADADKAKSAAFLAAVYRGAPALVDLPDVKTNADLVAKIAAAVHAPGLGLPDAAVPQLRKAVGAYLNAQLGMVASQPVDKAKAKACFAALAQALDTLTR